MVRSLEMLCNCLCHTSSGITHFIACCCPHRVIANAECQQCNGPAKRVPRKKK
jgi:hypothetical protein